MKNTRKFASSHTQITPFLHKVNMNDEEEKKKSESFHIVIWVSYVVYDSLKECDGNFDKIFKML